MQPICVIFNLMGTLVDSSERLARAYQITCIEFDETPPDAERIIERLGNTPLPIITQLLNPRLEQDRREEFFAACNRRADALMGKIAGNDVIEDRTNRALRDMKDNGIKLAVFSGARTKAVHAILAHNGMTDFFDAVAGNKERFFQDTISLKIELLFSIQRQLLFPTIGCWVVGDSTSDEQAAKTCGYNFTSAEQFRKDGYPCKMDC